MASEWRFNVWRIGQALPGPVFGGAPQKIEMVAKLITPINVSGQDYWWLINFGGEYPRQVIAARSTYGNDYVDVPVGLEVVDIPFPWGYDVEPDHE